MDNLMRKLPIGIQTFEGIRKENYLYVDKSALGQFGIALFSKQTTPLW